MAMEVERSKEYGSKGMTGTALGLGIGALGVELLRGGLGGILGGNAAPATTQTAATQTCANDALIASLLAAVGNGKCESDHMVTRYDAGKDAEIARLETEIKLRDANTYTDGKMLEMYQYIDGRLRGVEGQIAQQAVYNATNTAALNCMQGQIAQLQSLTKIVVPNSSVCPGWGAATVTVSTGTTTS